ncbi:hypothetical protein HPB49_010274 [Dermacentor silvarum]|uniref:Uncharacterized protein n=1 Tax=Dermacentor silvarum TaxID=543639 RepID=A0ACB8DNN3_DERSI|nr:hypothetical protein HPB49_010274 [Dermacentor silvarum]
MIDSAGYSPNIEEPTLPECAASCKELANTKFAESEALRHDTIGEQAHETYAYFVAPHDTSKGVIHGISKTETTADIRENIIHPGNPKAIEAHRIGETTAVLVLFQGQKVPSTVKYGVTIVRCSLYCQHHQVCRTCGKIGHRQDVCPQPNTKVCFACGKPNPRDTHAEECKPRCKLCNGPHPTGAPGCSNQFPPLKADRPLEERKRSASRSCLRGVQGGDSGRATSHGRESRSRSKRRTAQSARRESRSRERATWSEKVANHHRSKSRTPQIEDTMRALQQDNANLRAENQNLKAQVRELKQGQAEILRLLRAGQQPAGTTRMDITQAAQRSLTPTPPPQQVPDQRSATPLIAERTPTTEPPSTAPQHETVEDMEEHTAEISRPSFKEHRAMNRERESTNARLNRHEKRIELLEKRLTALKLRHPTNMDRNPTTRTRLRIWHWNANGFRCRKAVLQQHVASIGHPPDVIMIQETHMEDTPTLPGYRAYSSPPSAREHGKGAAQGVCTFVRKGLTSIHHENFLGRSSIEHCVTEIGLGRRKQEPILLANVYSNPTHGQQKFKALLHKTTKTSPNGTVVVCGDFNAPHKELGYNRTSAKGRDLLEEASNAGFVLYTDPGNPTRIGTSTTRDTNPDVTFARLSGKARGTATWRNTGHTWALDVEEEVPQIDSKLAHMIEARQSLQRRWKKQRHNRRLRKRVAELGRAIEKYSRELCTQQWHATCSAADGQLHKGQTWKLLRHLLDDKSTKGHQQHRLAQTIYTAVKTLGEEEASKRINANDIQCTDGLRTRLRWFPAHQGCFFGSTSPNRNEMANAAARCLTRRVVAPASLVLAEGVATDDEDDEEEAELVTSYADVLEWYRSARRSMPDPHPQLTREQAVLYRQLQTNSVLTPALARFICPDVYESSKCSVCNSATATLTHVLWDCKLNAEEAAAYPGRLPTDIARAVTAQDSEQQLQAVQRIETALARQTRRDAPDGTQGRQPRGERWIPRPNLTAVLSVDTPVVVGSLMLRKAVGQKIRVEALKNIQQAQKTPKRHFDGRNRAVQRRETP